MRLFVYVLLLALASIGFADQFTTNHRHAHANHILVKTKQECEDLKSKIDNENADFELLAKEYSTCPSGKRGGDLGTFGPGQMVAPFDKVVFSAEVGKVHGCVRTEFGYHLIWIRKRDDSGDGLAAVGGHAHLAEEDLKEI